MSTKRLLLRNSVTGLQKESERPVKHSPGKSLAKRAARKTMIAARATRETLRSVGASAGEFMGSEFATDWMPRPSLLDRLHTPLTWHREC